jgi:hypothetical protein
VHGLLELLLVEELEDEEDELAAERRHGCGRPFRGRSARSPREGGWRLRRPRILGFRGSSPPLSAREKRGDVEEGREERERERGSPVSLSSMRCRPLALFSLPTAPPQ